jgi:methyl-accepting chemotaxis protein
MHNAEKYRLRAEELRTIAGDSREEYQRFLLRIADDYEGMARSAETVVECRQSLAGARERLAPSGDTGSTDDRANACKEMASDAERLAFQADEASREAWRQLAKQWRILAENLGSPTVGAWAKSETR